MEVIEVLCLVRDDKLMFEDWCVVLGVMCVYRTLLTFMRRRRIMKKQWNSTTKLLSSTLQKMWRVQAINASLRLQSTLHKQNSMYRDLLQCVEVGADFGDFLQTWLYM